MDNIEQLLRDADPRMHRDSAGPLPLDLEEPRPVFTQQKVRETPKQRRSWRPVAVGGMLTGVILGVFIVPVLFVIFQHLQRFFPFPHITTNRPRKEFTSILQRLRKRLLYQ